MPLEPLPIHWLGDDGANCFVEVQGRLLAMAFRKGPRGFVLPKRGQVGSFSKASRLRLLKKCNRIEWERAGRCTFGTTTWHDDCGKPNQQRLTRFRDTFHRLVEHWHKRPVASLWRTEWKIRKQGFYTGQPMPHMHWIYVDCAWMPKEEYGQWAAKCMGVPELRCRLDECRGINDVWAYISKELGYVAKHSCGLVIDTYLNKYPHGRPWGVRRPELMPWAEKVEARCVPGEVSEEIRRLGIERWDGTPFDEDKGFTVMGADPAQATEILERFRLTLTRTPLK